MYRNRDNLCTSIPGVDDVTDGSVDDHDGDWESGHTYPEEDMGRPGRDCGGTEPSVCGQNSPRQTDEEEYEIINE